MDWRKPEGQEKGVVLPDNWIFLHYYEALNALFRVENALRVFVYVVLKNARKSKWTDLQLPSDDGGETTIAAIAKRRLAQDERFGYLGYRIASPLMHLTTGELIRLIFADAYWPMFAEFFPASREIARTKLEEIGNIRNALAHFRPIKADDVEVVKQNANQVLPGVETAVSNVLRTLSIVPTNTTDSWYGTLKQTSGQYCTISFRQSENERWVQLRLSFACPIIGSPQLGTSYRKWSLLTLQAPSLLKRAPAILENVIFAAESIPWIDASEEAPPFRKTIDFLFSRKTLLDAHEAIKGDLDAVIALITEETDLIREDNLARGALVRMGEVIAYNQVGNYWSRNVDALRSRPSDDDPAEYWGERRSAEANFITDTTSYPWMPDDVSEADVPF